MKTVYFEKKPSLLHNVSAITDIMVKCSKKSNGQSKIVHLLNDLNTKAFNPCNKNTLLYSKYNCKLQ